MSLTPEQWKEWIWDRRNICALHVTERLVYEPKPHMHFDRLALVHQDGTVLYEGSSMKGDTYHGVSAMLHQIVLHG